MDAESSCVASNGHLASIHSLEEHNFIYENVLLEVGNVWIGTNSDKNLGMTIRIGTTSIGRLISVNQTMLVE